MTWGRKEQELSRLANAVHQLFSFFDLGLVVTELPRDDLHSAGDPFPQAGLTLAFSAILATAGPLNVHDILGLVGRAEGLARLRTDGLGFGCDGLIWEIWEVLCDKTKKA